MIKKILFGLLGFLVILLVLVAIWLLIHMNYKHYDLKASPQLIEEYQKFDTLDDFVDHLIANMSLEEKLAQMWGEKPLSGYSKMVGAFFIKDEFPHVYVGKNERLHLPPWVLSDGPRGAVVGKGNTVFPVAMARGASWDVELEARVAEVIAKEMRANGTNYNAAPCINLLMHPAWGRAQETYGEDPFLLGEMAVAYIRSVQSHRVMACPKHFALNNIENSRFYVNVDLDDRSLHEVYLPHFKKAVQEGQPASIMSAYNQVRGDLAGHSHYLLEEVLRDAWDFEGFVSSDWINGLRDGVKGVKAGMDVEMPFRKHYGDELEAALRNGEVEEAEIDRMVRRILKTRLPFALFEDPMVYDKSLKASTEHQNLAKEVAEKSMVLLKNESVLPFENPKGKKIAVIGKIADAPNTGDKGSSRVRNDAIITPFAGIKAFAEKHQGEAHLNTAEDLEAAASLAKESDQVVLVVGYTHEDEGEFIIFTTDPVEDPSTLKNTQGGDRSSIALKEEDVAMIKKLVGINPNTVVVLVAGSAVSMEEWSEDSPAILYGWYSGMQGGHALANILYGAVNPSGKLPFTIPKKEEDLGPFDPWAKEVRYPYYHGYTKAEKENWSPAFAFGHGMSYTSFQYKEAKSQRVSYEAQDTLRFSVQLENTGSMAGEEIVQLYIGYSNASVDRPVKVLKGFQRVALAPGEQAKLNFDLDPKELRWYDPESKTWKLESMDYEFYLGPSSENEKLLKGKFSIN